MFENITAGWKLGGAVRKLIFEDKKLMVFPIVAAIVILVETVAIFASLFLFGAGSSVPFIAWLVIYYIIVYFTSTYILVAMLIAFRSFGTKTPVGFAGAFSKASGYFVQIFEWAVFESIVTMIIRVIEQRLGYVGAAIFGLAASMAMGTATAFAIPVIVDKKMGPIDTLKESTNFIIKNFGKTFGGLIYSELYSLIFIVAGIAMVILGLFTLGLLAVLGIALVVFGAMMSYLISNVYRFVLYDYMNGGKLPKGITDDMVKSSVKRQAQGRGGLGGVFGVGSTGNI